MRKINLSIYSRYTKTPLYQQTFSPGAYPISYYGTWQKAVLGTNGQTINVPEGQLARLDYLAYQYYGTEELWWVIAQANDIIDPIGEALSARSLFIPNLSEVQKSLYTNTRPPL